MAISDKLTKLQSDISDAYTTIATKGGTVPTDKNTDNLPDAIDSIPAGGGSTGDFYVRFYDCDGTLLKEQWVNQGEDATPPSNPNYDADRLTFRGWNHSYTNIQGDTACGALYTVNDHAIYYFLSVPASTTIDWQYINPTQAGTINWGDGTTETLAIASSLTNISHTYSAGGDYIIKIDGVSDYVDKVVAKPSSKYMIKAYIGNQYVHLASNDCFYTTSTNYGFNFWVFDSEIKAFGSGTSGGWGSLKMTIAIINDIENNFSNNHLFNPSASNCLIIVNDNCKTSIGNGAYNPFFATIEEMPNTHQFQTFKSGRPFNYSGIKYLNLKNLTSFSTETSAIVLGDIPNLREVYFEKLTSFRNASCFAGDQQLENIILNTTSKVAITGATARDTMKAINGIFKVYVPDNLVNTYKTDTYWSALAHKIKPISELPETSHFYRYVKNQINNN